jgi:hypothetical protein
MGCGIAVRAQNVPPEPSTRCASPACWRCTAASCRLSRSLAPPSSPRLPSRAFCAVTPRAWLRSRHLRPSLATSVSTRATSFISTSRSLLASFAPATALPVIASTITRQVPALEFLHIAIDDHSRIAFAQLLPDETARSSIAFLHAALAFFERLGVRTQRIYSDNGSCYRAHAMREAVAALGLKHRFTRPYTPKTNGRSGGGDKGGWGAGERPNASSKPPSVSGLTPTPTPTPPNAQSASLSSSTTTTSIALTIPSNSARPSHVCFFL